MLNEALSEGIVEQRCGRRPRQLFLGASTLATGWGTVATKVLPALLGWTAIVAGLASALTVLTTDTPLAFLDQTLYIPSLLLAIVFRTTWAGPPPVTIARNPHNARTLAARHQPWDRSEQGRPGGREAVASDRTTGAAELAVDNG